MRRILKILLVTSLSVLFCLAIVYYFFIGQYKVNCSPFSNEFYEWFPYNEGDKLIFMNKSLSKSYTVINYQSNYTESYQSNLKCGCCEDNITITLANENDTLKINFQNLDYKKSCLGSSMEINESYIDLDEKQIDSINKQKRIRIGNYLIEKKKGISEFKLLEETWKLQKTVKSNSKNKLTRSNCN